MSKGQEEKRKNGQNKKLLIEKDELIWLFLHREGHEAHEEKKHLILCG
jgi:hypothetical protein